MTLSETSKEFQEYRTKYTSFSGLFTYYQFGIHTFTHTNTPPKTNVEPQRFSGFSGRAKVPEAAAADAPAVIQQRVRDRQIQVGIDLKLSIFQWLLPLQAALAAAERAALGSDDELEADEFAAS